jgi:hypothetical protein
MFTILTIGVAVVIAIISAIKINSISYSLKAVMRDRDESRLMLEAKIIQLETELRSLYEANSKISKTSADSHASPAEKPAKPKRKYYNKPKNPKA